MASFSINHQPEREPTCVDQLPIKSPTPPVKVEESVDIIKNSHEPSGNPVKPKRKRPKKTKMKDIMAGLMTASRTDEELRQEHMETIRKNLGGGGFQKLDKV